MKHHQVDMTVSEALEKMSDIPHEVQTYLKTYEEWIEQWQEWAKIQKHKRQVQKLYDYFFQLRQTIKSEEKSLEIMMGIGMLTYQIKTSDSSPNLTNKIRIRF